MNTKPSPKKKFKISSWLIIAILFIAIICILLWIKRTLTEYNELAYEQCVEAQVNTFDSILEEAISSGKYGLEDSTYRLREELESNIDKDKLERCLSSGNESYDEFDEMLRNAYQTNIYTEGTEMNENRNSILVICNERLIGSYTHDYTLYDKPVSVQSQLNIREVIEKNAYNKELSLHALDQIENQQIQDLMIWQIREPEIDMPKYSVITKDTLKEIFRKYGLKGLESFEILIPTYITKYGNVFGESDIPGLTNSTSNNKIIVIQRLNIVDYINYHFPEAFNSEELYVLEQQSSIYNNYVNILIILECIMIVAFGFSFVTYYNHILIEDEYEDAISSKEQK